MIDFKGKNRVEIAIFYFFYQEMARWCYWIAGMATFSGGKSYHKKILISIAYFMYKEHEW